MEETSINAIVNSLLGSLSSHPAIGVIIFVALSLWPLARIFRRQGQSPLWALLFLSNLIIPFAGFIAAPLAFIFKKKARA